MQKTLFISDLHLADARPSISALFFHFLESTVTQSDTVYILGDLFDYWVGDDQLEHDALGREVAAGLRKCVDSGTRIFLMHGNRDFMLGEGFALAAGLTLLPDPTVIDLRGRPAMLMHGDALCTDDVAYQQFRLQARNPVWQQAMLSKPFAVRQALAQSIRMQSDSEKSGKAEEIMDVAPASVETAFRNHGYPLIIHGHTHRPATHRYDLDGHACERWVLADWHLQGEYLCASDGQLARIGVTGSS